MYNQYSRNSHSTSIHSFVCFPALPSTPLPAPPFRVHSKYNRLSLVAFALPCLQQLGKNRIALSTKIKLTALEKFKNIQQDMNCKAPPNHLPTHGKGEGYSQRMRSTHSPRSGHWLLSILLSPRSPGAPPRLPVGRQEGKEAGSGCAPL